MEFPKPTPGQAKWLWLSITALAISVFLSIIFTLILGGAWLIGKLSAILIPVAVAAIVACILDPLVVYLESLKIRRQWGVLAVFLVIGGIVAVFVSWVIPVLFVEINSFVTDVPAITDKIITYAESQANHVNKFLSQSGWEERLRFAWDQGLNNDVETWITGAVTSTGAWLLHQFSHVLSIGSFIIGILLIPIYTYYFLIERESISMRWTNYIPLWESKVKEEVVWFLNTISDSMVVFFRGQILVALCEGCLLTIGFLAIGMKYAFLIGAVAGVFSIIPYLGMALSIIPALLIAAAQFGDMLHPLLVVLVYLLVHLFDGYVVFPHVIGDRVGMHPVIIIIAVLVGTTLMGGIVGAILAIPVTAVLRAIMCRYVWLSRIPKLEGDSEGKSSPTRKDGNATK